MSVKFRRIISVIIVFLFTVIITMPVNNTYAATKKGVCIDKTYRLFPDIFGPAAGVVTPNAKDNISFKLDLQSRITSVNVKQTPWTLYAVFGFIQLVPSKNADITVSKDKATVKTYWTLRGFSLSSNMFIAGYNLIKLLISGPTSYYSLCITYTLKNNGTITYKYTHNFGS